MDFAYLARETAGDEELALELLLLFTTQAREIAQRLERDGDGDRRALVHTLKGSAAAIGAFAVARAAEDCEAALAGGSPPPLDALGRALAAALATIELRIEQRRA